MVLQDIKKLIGFDADYNAYDQDLIIFTNSVLAVLKQIGVDVRGTLSFEAGESWEDILGKHADIEMIKEYVYLRVKMVFDPPASATIANAYNETIKELEWRINLEVEVPSDSVMEGDI